jgi:tetratricopeptide (TPR) repeat protein
MRWLLTLVLVLLPLVARADEERFDDRVRELFFSGFAGVSEKLAQGMAICEAALKENPENAEAMVWHGAGVFFRSGQAFRAGNLAEGERLRAEGLGELDRAVDLKPHSLSTLVPRATTLFAAARFAPPTVGEPWLRRAVADFEEVEAINRQLSGLSEHDKGEVLGALAEGWDRLGDKARSEAYLERIRAELPPQSAYAERAEAWLGAGQRPDRMTCLSCHKRQD